MFAMPLVTISNAFLATSRSPLGPAIGQGAHGFAPAAAGVVGAFAAGWAAAEFGFRSLALLLAVGAELAFVVLLLVPNEPGRA